MDTVVRVSHYLPSQLIRVSITYYEQGTLTDKQMKVNRQFCLDLKTAKREREANINQLLDDIATTGDCGEMRAWMTHKIDQMVAAQREWNKGFKNE